MQSDDHICLYEVLRESLKSDQFATRKDIWSNLVK